VKKSICRIDVNGDRRWYLNGLYHRVDGPAVEYANGDKWWYLNGQHHRVDGPAIELANGNTAYWINGERIPQLNNKRIYGKENLQKFLLLI